MLEWFYAGAFSGWFVLSVLNQFQTEKLEGIQRVDVFHLLPVWTFFAPNPGRSDYHMLWRDRLLDGRLTAWEDVAPIPRNSLRSAFWNPDKRRPKVVSDAVSGVVEFVAKGAVRGHDEAAHKMLLIFGPYLLLAHVALAAVDHHKDAQSFQFVIVERYGFGEGNGTYPILKSPFHSLR